MAVTKSKKYAGVYRVDGKKGISFGIDYIYPQTGARIRKILKDANSEADAIDARSIEIADAKRGAFNKAYSIHDDRRPVLFDDKRKSALRWTLGVCQATGLLSKWTGTCNRFKSNLLFFL